MCLSEKGDGGNILAQEKARNKRTEKPERLRLAVITFKL
jgi:hypothetical protein